MPIGHRAQDTQQRLQLRPAATAIDVPAVLGKTPGGCKLIGRQIVAIEVPISQQPAREHAEREQLHATRLAQAGHLARSAPIEQGVRHLVRRHAHAAHERHACVVRIEVTQPHVAHVGVLGQQLELVEPRAISIFPRVELQQVDRRRAKARESGGDGRVHNRCGRVFSPWHGHPLREALHRAGRARACHTSRQDLRTSVVIGHVEGAESGLPIEHQVPYRSFHIEACATLALQVGHLPQAGHHARDDQRRREAPSWHAMLHIAHTLSG